MKTQRTLLNLVVLLISVNTNFIFAQKYLLPNEVLLYSFETQNGKRVVLAKDQKEEYIMYRFGTKNHIEFEFPEKTKDSWNKFTYSFYFRGGGIQNEGMDLNYITFTNQEYKYVIYDTYYAVGNETSIGIRIKNLRNNKTTDIKGRKNTQKGNLVDFRFNNLIKTEEEIEE